jgi:hypothetical protein
MRFRIPRDIIRLLRILDAGLKEKPPIAGDGRVVTRSLVTTLILALCACSYDPVF